MGHCQAFSWLFSRNFSAFAFKIRKSKSSAMCLCTIISASICISCLFKRAILSATALDLVISLIVCPYMGVQRHGSYASNVSSSPVLSHLTAIICDFVGYCQAFIRKKVWKKQCYTCVKLCRSTIQWPFPSWLSTHSTSLSFLLR